MSPNAQCRPALAFPIPASNNEVCRDLELYLPFEDHYGHTTVQVYSQQGPGTGVICC